MTEYVFILANALAFNLFALGVLMLRSRKIGGIWFARAGRVRVSFCIARR